MQVPISPLSHLLFALKLHQVLGPPHEDKTVHYLVVQAEEDPGSKETMGSEVHCA